MDEFGMASGEQLFLWSLFELCGQSGEIPLTSQLLSTNCAPYLSLATAVVGYNL